MSPNRSNRSEESAANSAEPSLPPPPNGRRWGTLLSVTLVGVLACLVAAALLPAARFALVEGEAQKLGALAQADLDAASPWVHGSGQPSEQALSFRRRGSRGSFRLTRLNDRDDLWLVLSVPDGVNTSASEPLAYVPPTHFTGRLLPLRDVGLHYAPIIKMIEDSGHSADNGFLLLDGEMPNSHLGSLLAAIFLGLLGSFCLVFAGRLALRIR